MTLFFAFFLLLLFLLHLWPCYVSLTEHINRFNNNVFLHFVRVIGEILVRASPNTITIKKNKTIEFVVHSIWMQAIQRMHKMSPSFDGATR